MKRLTSLLTALFVCLFFSSPVAPQQQSVSDIPPTDPLGRSLILIDDTISLVESIQSDNESLKTALENVSGMLQTQGRLLNEQAKTQAEQSAISQRQALLLNRELRKGKILKWSLIISVPACIGLGVWAGIEIHKAASR